MNAGSFTRKTLAVLTAAALQMVASGADRKVYVDAENGSDDNDGSSPAKAFKTPTKAFRSISGTDRRIIYFAPGTYHLAGAAGAGQGVQWNLVGTSDNPADTIIDGDNDYRAFFNHWSSGGGENGARNGEIRNLTFRNCRSKLGETAWYWNAAQTVKFRPLSEFGFAGGAFTMAPTFVKWLSTKTAGSATGTANSDCLVSNCVFEACGNEAYAQGHALAVAGGARVIDCIFRNNGSDCTRAPIGYAAKSATITDAKTADWNVEGDNVSGGEGAGGSGAVGGAVYVYPGSNCTNYFINCLFEGNYTKAGASCICAQPTVWTGSNNSDTLEMWKSNWGIVLQGCTFVSNRTDALVGGIGGVVRGKILRAENCDFIGNVSAGAYGAALSGPEDDDAYYSAYATVLPATSWIINCNFISNRSDGVCAGYNPGGYAKSIVSNCTFFANVASNGVAICTRRAGIPVLNTSSKKMVSCSSMTLADCTFEKNKATSSEPWDAENGKGRYQDGIALASKYTTNEVVRCTFRENSALSGASGIAVGDGSMVVDCTFSNNVVRGGAGGCVMMEGVNVTVAGCLFVNNHNDFTNSTCFAGDYGYEETVALRWKSEGESDRKMIYGSRKARIYKCTFVGNEEGVYWGPYAKSNIGRGYDNADEYGIFEDCIFESSPVAPRGKTVLDTSGQSRTLWVANRSYLAENPSSAGTGNVQGTNPGFRDAAAGDYRLKKNSGCHNVGHSFDWMTDYPTDLQGLSWLNADSQYDLGALTYVPYSVGLMLLFR